MRDSIIIIIVIIPLPSSRLLSSNVTLHSSSKLKQLSMIDMMLGSRQTHTF